MQKWKYFSAAILTTLIGYGSIAQEAAPEAPLTEFPRNETLIIHNPENQITNPGWFNIWVGGGGSWSNGLQQLTMDTLWYIDPDAGIDGALYNSLASDVWQYNDDFSEMTVTLREGIKWSDGEDFNAEDVVYTVETVGANPGLRWHGQIVNNVESVEAIDDYTVKFTLIAPNSRFHTVFSVRWAALYIMPEHVFSKVEDPTTYDFNPPVSLGAYTLSRYDPNGFWYAWEKRDDWDKTTVAAYGEPAPQYIIYRGGIPTDLRQIEMANDQLDMIHDLTPEGMFALARQDELAQGWFDGFPYAHPDPTLPMLIFNHQRGHFADKRVRWALALMLDARAISMASYRGAATLSAINVPPTGTHPQDYHGPMQEWLTNFELDTGSRTITPYDPDIGLQIAEMVRPQYGDSVPTDPTAIRNAFGYGWWKQDLEAAAELLESAGFTKDGDQWMTPDGEVFGFTLLNHAEGVLGRLGSMVGDNLRSAGVDVTVEVAPDLWTRNAAGDFDTLIAWSVESWGGHPDLSFFLDSWHSQFVAEPGDIQPDRNWQRWSDPRLDAIIEEIRGIDFNDPKGIELGREFVKLAVEEMPNIPLMSFNVFSAQSNKYWTGWPSADNPYANPVTNWGNSRYIFTQIEPVAN